MSFTLGQEVQFTGTMQKSREYWKSVFRPGPLPNTTSMYRDDPENRPFQWVDRVTEFNTGVIVGKRTIADYDISGGYDESYSATAVPGTHRPAWLVAWNLHRKPVLVLESQIVVKETE